MAIVRQAQKHVIKTKAVLDVSSYAQVTVVHGVEAPHDANARIRLGYDHHPELHIFDWSILRDQRAPSMKFVGRDTNFGAQAILKSVSEARRALTITELESTARRKCIAV